MDSVGLRQRKAGSPVEVEFNQISNANTIPKQEIAKLVGEDSARINKKCEETAKTIANDKKEVKSILDRIKQLSNHFGSGIKEEIETLIHMINCHVAGERFLEVKTLLAILACFVYIISPLDLVPDTLPGIG